MPVHAAVASFDLHIPQARSLKAKRAALKPIVEGLRRRFSVSVAEVAHHDQWQRAGVGVAVVASTHAHVCDILDEVERFVWSHPDVAVLDSTREFFDGAS